ncbi:hypothetical protein AYK24_04690 [Thermoplasmatales archaeon SG8-52-4]|nr:MAG: hypothetical protein AYK24_04690 [Thermoplasmatales archaeon SG8-52-4]
MFKKIKFKTIFCFLLVLLFVLQNVNVIAEISNDDTLQITRNKIESTDPDSGYWKKITGDGFGKATNLASRGLAIYKNELYIGTQNTKLPKIFYDRFPEFADVILKMLPNILPKLLQMNVHLKFIYQFKHLIKYKTVQSFFDLLVSASDGCEIWKYNYTTDSLQQVVGDKSLSGMKSGFNYTYNCLAGTMIEFNDKLYVGTWSTPLGNTDYGKRNGGEIWRYDGTTWEQVVGHIASYTKGGFGNPDNIGIFDFIEFNSYLYTGTMNWDFSFKGGCEIWRTQDGLNWEKVVDHGFKPFMSDIDKKSGVTNTYCWKMEVYKNYLYAGTYNSLDKFSGNSGMGCQLWRTKDGTDWEKVNLPKGDGFGEKENYGIRTMAVYNDELYVGTAANLLLDNGFEIWKYDGVNWTPVISDEVAGAEPTDIEYDGFGNPLNKYAWCMTVTSDNKLWIGTANGKLVNLMEPISSGCEVWCFNGINWEPIVKDGNNEKQSGFGNLINEGARSIIEYPEGSGNVVIGTFKLNSTRLLFPREGFDLWMRIK